MIVVGCYWVSKISQNVEKMASSWEKKLVFWTKIDLLKNPPKIKSFLQDAIEIVQSLNRWKVASSWEKKVGFSKKILSFFENR